MVTSSFPALTCANSHVESSRASCTIGDMLKIFPLIALSLSACALTDLDEQAERRRLEQPDTICLSAADCAVGAPFSGAERTRFCITECHASSYCQIRTRITWSLDCSLEQLAICAGGGYCPVVCFTGKCVILTATASNPDDVDAEDNASLQGVVDAPLQ